MIVEAKARNAVAGSHNKRVSRQANLRRHRRTTADSHPQQVVYALLPGGGPVVSTADTQATCVSVALQRTRRAVRCSVVLPQARLFLQLATAGYNSTAVRHAVTAFRPAPLDYSVECNHKIDRHYCCISANASGH